MAVDSSPATRSRASASLATPRRFTVAILSSLGLLLVVLALAPLIGSVPVNLGAALAGRSPDAEILFQARLPRVLLALLAGGALAVAGVLFQALLRNPLATPYTLGVSSGASLGAVIAIVTGLRAAFHLPGVWVCAFAGAFLTLALVIGAGRSAGRISASTLLLAGVSVNAICIAVVLFLQYFSSLAQSFAIVRWLMGGVEPISYPALAAIAVLVGIVVVYVFSQARNWNLLSVGETWGASRGVSVQRLMMGGYLSASLLTGAVTAITGPIGFVGLIVPHALRILLGPDHRVLLPCAFLAGAAFLAACDTAARVILSPADVPVGVVTALLGGPFFILLLRRRGPGV
ncbi:MAG: iron ABC transporter permease [Bryobacterales bacterium]|nr:iron ABC transporter permease [Bryobacterales bacterium]